MADERTGDLRDDGGGDGGGVQHGHGQRGAADLGRTGRDHQRQPAVFDDPGHGHVLLRLHVARGHAAQRHRLLGRQDEPRRHGDDADVADLRRGRPGVDQSFLFLLARSKRAR